MVFRLRERRQIMRQHEMLSESIRATDAAGAAETIVKQIEYMGLIYARTQDERRKFKEPV